MSKLDKDGLLPCPFCKSKGDHRQANKGKMHWILCTNSKCGAQMGVSRYSQEAKDAWNMRHKRKHITPKETK